MLSRYLCLIIAAKVGRLLASVKKFLLVQILTWKKQILILNLFPNISLTSFRDKDVYPALIPFCYLCAQKAIVMFDANKLNDEIYIQNCPIRNVLSRICEKWSILTIFTLEQFPVMRFGELHRMIPDISQKMLAITLRTLEEDGLVARKAYAEIPPRVEYSLTQRGKRLLPRLNALIEWAKEEQEGILQDRQTK